MAAIDLNDIHSDGGSAGDVTNKLDRATTEQRKAQDSLLMESNQDLTIASEQSDSLSNQIVVLDSQLTESQNQIETLKQQLITLKQQTAAAQTSLKTANEELASASASFKKYEKEQEKIEGQLKTQKNIWQIIAGLAVGYAVSK